MEAGKAVGAPIKPNTLDPCAVARETTVHPAYNAICFAMRMGVVFW